MNFSVLFCTPIGNIKRLRLPLQYKHAGQHNITKISKIRPNIYNLSTSRDISSSHGGEYEAQSLCILKSMSTDVSEVRAASIITIALMLEADLTYETSVDIDLRTRHYIPEDSELPISYSYLHRTDPVDCFSYNHTNINLHATDLSISHLYLNATGCVNCVSYC
jgi:hypothetical protein